MESNFLEIRHKKYNIISFALEIGPFLTLSLHYYLFYSKAQNQLEGRLFSNWNNNVWGLLTHSHCLCVALTWLECNHSSKAPPSSCLNSNNHEHNQIKIFFAITFIQLFLFSDFLMSLNNDDFFANLIGSAFILF